MNREYGKGLAINLIHETLRKPNKLTLIHSVADVLSIVESEVHINKQWLSSELQKAHTGIDDLLIRAGAAISGEATIQYSLFITENPDNLYMKYESTIPCMDVTGENRMNIILVLNGSGTIRPKGPTIIGIHVDDEGVTFESTDGIPGQLRNVYMSSYVSQGHQTITHSVRHPLTAS